MTEQQLPKIEGLFWPALKALESKGGSSGRRELFDQIASDMELLDEVLEIPRPGQREKEVAYRFGWALTYLKHVGLVDNPSRGVWAITKRGREIQNEGEARALVNQGRTNYWARHREKSSAAGSADEGGAEDVEEAKPDWRDELLGILRRMKPAAFERLCQRALRESGFIKVDVTGRPGDGGIDGTGVLRVNLLSFRVRFRCKRYAGSVGARDSRVPGRDGRRPRGQGAVHHHGPIHAGGGVRGRPGLRARHRPARRPGVLRVAQEIEAWCRGDGCRDARG